MAPPARHLLLLLVAAAAAKPQDRISAEIPLSLEETNADSGGQIAASLDHSSNTDTDKPKYPVINTTAETVSVKAHEENWTIVAKPRCCSDCTFVAAGFKCKVKSCLLNCPWANKADAAQHVNSLIFAVIWAIGFLQYAIFNEA